MNVEAAQGARENVHRGIRAILSEMADRAEYHLEDQTLHELGPEILTKKGEDTAFNAVLNRWSKALPLPLMLLIDEIDTLVGDTLISVLRQLRSGYDRRPGSFPQSVILCGVRDVRDYRIHSQKEKMVITGGSAFNIKAESLRLGDFSKDDVTALFGLHTSETGQKFDPDALERVWKITEGQPWLVNAIGYEVCFETKTNQDRSRIITREMIEEAKERLIQRRDTHIDQLMDKLSEDRIRKIIALILEGKEKPVMITDDDLQYGVDLGLIKTDGQVRIANEIYREVIPRALTYTTQVTISPGNGVVCYRRKRAPRHGETPLGFSGFFPQTFGTLDRAIRLQGSRPATAAPGLFATDHQP